MQQVISFYKCQGFLTIGRDDKTRIQFVRSYSLECYLRIRNEEIIWREKSSKLLAWRVGILANFSFRSSKKYAKLTRPFRRLFGYLNFRKRIVLRRCNRRWRRFIRNKERH